MALSFCVSPPLNQTQTRLSFRKSGISHRFPVRGVIYGECEKAPSSVPLVCHPSPSLRRAHDVLPCSIPFSTPLTLLSISPRLSFYSFLDLSFVFHRGSQRLPFGDTPLNTRLLLTRDIHDLSTTHFKSLHATLTHTLPIPLPSLHLFLLCGFPFPPSTPYAFLFLFSDLSIRLLLFVRCTQTAP